MPVFHHFELKKKHTCTYTVDTLEIGTITERRIAQATESQLIMKKDNKYKGNDDDGFSTRGRQGQRPL